jgi:hypothetical protein
MPWQIIGTAPPLLQQGIGSWRPISFHALLAKSVTEGEKERETREESGTLMLLRGVAYYYYQNQPIYHVPTRQGRNMGDIYCWQTMQGSVRGREGRKASVNNDNNNDINGKYII